MTAAGSWIGGFFLITAACSRPPVAVEPLAKAVPRQVDGSDDGLPEQALRTFGATAELRIAGREAGPVFRVEVARTEAERAQGLMYRRRLGDSAGMVFFMPGDDVWQFWMRNTLISLDMIFVDRTWRVVGVVPSVPPLTEVTRGVDAKSCYVVELAAGQAQRWAIETGTELKLGRLTEVGR